MRILHLLKNLLLILLLAVAGSGAVSAKVASGPQNLGLGLHQAASWLEAAPRLGWDGFSYDAAPGSSVVTKGAERAATGFKGSKGFELKNAPYQKVRNEATTINGRDFSGHALDQMQNRGIMPSVVENTIKTGQTFSTRAGTTGFYDSVNNVRVITNSETGRIVTVIRGAPN
jgi:hypothetical protein